MGEGFVGGSPSRPRRGRPERGGRFGRRGGAPTRARLLALRVLERVERARAYADLALHAALGRSELSGPDRALATELVYGTLRWRGRLDHALNQVLDRELQSLEPLVITALRLGAYQLLFADRIPASAAVDQSVRCVRAAGAERATGLVNAVLRRLREKAGAIAIPELEVDPIGHLVHGLSLPTWLAERFMDDFAPEGAAALARASNEVPPRTVRANPARTTADALAAELGQRFDRVTRGRYGPLAVILGRSGDAARDPAFLDGRFTVQDEASQLVVELLDPQPGERVLDTCAAPGGKATASAERVGPDGAVVALDRHKRRLDLLKRDARRLGLTNVRTLEMDASRPLPELDTPGGFQRVLVDAPCSGLGTLRRNPDARWRVRPTDPARLAELQFSILQQAAVRLEIGGCLVYSTCTLLREENEAVIERFLSEVPGFRQLGREELPVPVQPLVGTDGFLRTLPHLHDTDGFFAARLEKTS